MAKRKSARTPGAARPERPAAGQGRGSEPRPGPRPGSRQGSRRAAAGRDLWLYGSHAVLAALANPARQARKLLVTAEAERRFGPELKRLVAGRQAAPQIDTPGVESADRNQIAALLPDGAVHQGLALQTAPLAPAVLEDLLAGSAAQDGARRRVLLALDQVTDPQNVGAILRSAAAFGALGVITTQKHAAPESGALAKAASGALETLPLALVPNLRQALETCQAAGFWTLGLAGEASQTLAEADSGGPLLLVLGAEGDGLRRLTRETCDALARLPMAAPIGSLNVSNAAAVALYQVLAR